MIFKRVLSFILLLSAGFANLQCAEKEMSEYEICEDYEKYEIKENAHLFETFPLLFNLDIFSNEKRNFCHYIMQRMYDNYLLNYKDSESTLRYNERYNKRYLEDFRLKLIDFLQSDDSILFNFDENLAFNQWVIFLIDSYKCLDIKCGKVEKNWGNISKLLDKWSSFLNAQLILDAQHVTDKSFII